MKETKFEFVNVEEFPLTVEGLIEVKLNEHITIPITKHIFRKISDKNGVYPAVSKFTYNVTGIVSKIRNIINPIEINNVIEVNHTKIIYITLDNKSIELIKYNNNIASIAEQTLKLNLELE